MKKYLTLFGIIAMFFIGMQTTVAQEQTKKQTKEQEEYATKKRALAKSQKEALSTSQTLSAEEIADQKTKKLNELLNLDEDKFLRVQELFLAVETKKERLMALSDGGDKTDMIQQLEDDKMTRLKDILKPEQFEKYQNSIVKQ